MTDLVVLTEFLVKNLVAHPEEVAITKEGSESDITLNVLVSESDIGSVIGRSGKTANSIRTLVQASAYLHNQGRVRVNINSK